MNPEIPRDLRQRNIGVTVQSNPHHIIAELSGKRLRHDDILPGQPPRASQISCHLPVQQTPAASYVLAIAVALVTLLQFRMLRSKE